MSSGARAASSAGGPSGLRDRVVDWLLLEGDRRLIAAGLVVAVTGVTLALVVTELIAVGPGSSVASLFGSGLTAGVVTLLTIALSINQLILSRVFGSPDVLMDRLEGARTVRHRVEELAGQPSSANDPAAFLSLLARTIVARARSATDPDTPAEVTETLADVAAYAESIDAQVQSETPVTDILGIVIGPEYAINMTAVRHLREEYGSDLTEAAQADLEAVGELLECVAVVRQFFKTIALQQDFAALSRLLVYTGLVALFVTASLTLVYSTGAATLTTPTLRVVVPLALGVVVAPLALFATYILRAATVAHRTVSVGPFIPPSER